MKRFIKVYCEDLKQEIKLPIEIDLKNDNSCCMVSVDIPEQHYCIGHEFLWTTAHIVELEER